MNLAINIEGSNVHIASIEEHRSSLLSYKRDLLLGLLNSTSHALIIALKLLSLGSLECVGYSNKKELSV